MIASMNVSKSLFVFYRALPFALFILLDLILIGLSAFDIFDPFRAVTELDRLVLAVWLVLPIVILLGGGHYVRKLHPQSKFGSTAVLISTFLAVFNLPALLIVGCFIGRCPY